MLKKLKERFLRLEHFRKFIGQEFAYNAVRSNFKLEINSSPPNGRVLILSPHPDDDILGCGGVIQLHGAAGNEVEILYLSDGSMGFPDIKRPTTREKAELVRMREFEVKESAKILAVKDLVFWRYRDGNLSANSSAVKLMQNLLNSYKPEIIYLPSFQDSNSDHFESCKIFVEAMKETSLDPEIISYEVWSPLFANRIISIDKVFEQKKQAILTHRSQLKSRGYLSAIIGLNQYRAGMFNAGNYAEAFFSCNKELYFKLFDLMEFKKK